VQRPQSLPGNLKVLACSHGVAGGSGRSANFRTVLKTILRSVAAVGAIACTDLMSTAAAQSGCITGMVEFVQMTSMQLDAGEQTFEAFRVMQSGTVEWARWNSSGYLLDLARLCETDSNIYDKVMSSPSFMDSPKPREDEGTLGREAFRFDAAILSKSGVRGFSTSKMPHDLAALSDELRRRVAATKLRPGLYVWTKPYPSTDKADIDLTKGRCDAPVERALSEALASGSLIVRADDNIQAFVSGERANRIEFSARIAVGDLRFGVLSAK